MLVRAYDLLDRATSKTYANPPDPSDPNVAAVAVKYDSPTGTGTPVAPFIGRVQGETDGAGAMTVGGYDVMGRATSVTRSVFGDSQTMSYAYNEAGQ